MRILSFVTEPSVVKKILEHLESRADDARAPPRPDFENAALAS